MTSNLYTPTHRSWDHVGNLVPNWEHSEGIRPAMYGFPAPWLPVQIEDKFYEVWTVVAAGRPVALTTDEYLAPAGLKVLWAGLSGGDAALAYTANDVDEKVIDLTTGEPLTAAVTYTKTQLTTALKSRGLIGSSDDCDDMFSYAVGLAAQNYYSWASYTKDGFNPADLKFHNFRMQHQVAVLCDYVIRVPWLASAATTETMDASLTGSTAIIGSANLFSATNTKLLVRYSNIDNTNFISWCSASWPIAKNTARTPFSADDASLLIRAKSSPEQLTTAGDYYVDTETGVWFFYVSGGASVPSTVASTVLTFNEYSTVPTSVGDYVSATGALKPGVFVEVDANSNFTLSSSTDFRVVMGQVLGFIRHPKDKLDRVKTRYTGLGTVNQMPGTATSGYPDTLNVTETGADTEVIINLVSR